MQVRRTTLDIATYAPIELLDITAQVRAWVAECARGDGVRNGLLTLSSLHTTARIMLNERDQALQRDMVTFLTQLAPQDAPYAHNLNTVDGRVNAHAHLLGMLISASESIPVADGELVMGAWQSIFFVELDGPRDRREVQLQLLGGA
jgi:secondary thiamine-phosphate synthase enzyme